MPGWGGGSDPPGAEGEFGTRGACAARPATTCYSALIRTPG
jgi:hypothetical protein